MADADLAARIADLATLIDDHTVEDEEAAQEAQKVAPPPWFAANSLLLTRNAEGTYSTDVAEVTDYRYDAVLTHAARNDPARALRHVKAVRDLVAEILAEPHDYNPSDEFYSCSQAVPYETDEPGSGCANPDRAGQPCDCGRDERVARMLGIIASEWEG